MNDSQKYYIANRERIKARQNEYRRKNREHVNELARTYYKKKNQFTAWSAIDVNNPSPSALINTDTWEKRMLIKWKRQGRLNAYGYLAIKVILLILFAFPARAANLEKPRFSIQLVHPIHVARVSDLAPHIKENNGFQPHLSLGELIGTAIEIKHLIAFEPTLAAVQWHADRKLFSVRRNSTDEVVLIDPKEHGELHSVFVWKAHKVCGHCISDILRAFD